MKRSWPIFAVACFAGLFRVAEAQNPATGAGQGAPAPRVASIPIGAPRDAGPAATPAPIAADSASTTAQPDDLLARTERMLDGLTSLQAKIRTRVDLFDHQITGEGLYLQQGRGGERVSRLELRSRAGDRSTLTLQICDGHYFWTYRDLGAPEPTITQVNLERVQIAVAAATANGAVRPAPAIGLSLGGLPRLVSGARRGFQFTSVAQVQLGNQRTWALDGQLSPAMLIAAVPDQKGTIEAGKTIELKKLPPQLPERMVMYLDNDNGLMPCRVVYHRRAAKGETAGQGGAPPGYRTIMALEIFDVAAGAALDPRQFTFQPKGLTVTDATDAYLRSIGVTPK